MTSNTAHETIVRRVKALLAQAESTNHFAEAETFSAKAQELIARYSIDQAILLENNNSIDKIIREDVTIINPYAKHRIRLLHRLCIINTIDIVRLFQYTLDKNSRRQQKVALVGFKKDIELTLLLFDSLQNQMVHSLVNARYERPSHVHQTTFAAAFLFGYIEGIQEKLNEAYNTQITAIKSTSPEYIKTMEIALQDKRIQVEKEFTTQFPNTTKAQRSITRLRDWSARSSGQVAGKNASLATASIANRKALNK